MTRTRATRSCPVCDEVGHELPGYERVGLERCGSCGLVFSGAAGAQTRKYESDEYATTHAEFFEERRAFAHIARKRVRWLGRWTVPGKVLELGPGSGHFLAAAKAAGHASTGVEASPLLAARIEQEFAIPVALGDLGEVGLPRDHFDAVCMFHVLEHVDDPVGTLLAAREVLKPGGVLAIEVPNFGSVMAAREGDRWVQVQPEELHVSHFDPHSMAIALDRAGFQTVEMDTVSTWYYTMPVRRLRPRALAGYGYRAKELRTLGSVHPKGFDNLRVVAGRGD